MDIVVQLKEEKEKTKELLSENEKLKKNLKILKDSRLTEYKRHRRRQTEQQRDIAQLNKDIIGLAERCGEQSDEIFSKIPDVAPLQVSSPPSQPLKMACSCTLC